MLIQILNDLFNKYPNPQHLIFGMYNISGIITIVLLTELPRHHLHCVGREPGRSSGDPGG